jgi:hypothetical protein
MYWRENPEGLLKKIHGIERLSHLSAMMLRTRQKEETPPSTMEMSSAGSRQFLKVSIIFSVFRIH